MMQVAGTVNMKLYRELIPLNLNVHPETELVFLQKWHHYKGILNLSRLVCFCL